MSFHPANVPVMMQPSEKRRLRGSRNGRRWAYLFIYNGAMCSGWFVVAVQMVRGFNASYAAAAADPSVTAAYTCTCPIAPTVRKAIVLSHGFQGAYVAGEVMMKGLLLAANMEIVHAATGYVRSPIGTTLFQTLVRIVIVGISLQFDSLKVEVMKTPWPGLMLASWTSGEVIRYSYYVANLLAERRKAAAGEKRADIGRMTPPAQPADSRHAAIPPARVFVAPRWLTWLRYSAFLILYPAGFASEMACLFSSISAIERTQHDSLFASWIPTIMKLTMVTCYPPGMYMMYTHMLSQRKKVMRRLASD